MSRILMAVALAACVGGLLAYLWADLGRIAARTAFVSARKSSSGPRVLPEVLQACALVFLTASIAVRFAQSGQPPFVTTQEFASTFAWGIIVFGLAFAIRHGHTTRLASVSSLALAVVLLAWVVVDYPQSRSLMPALQNNPLFLSHVGVAVVAYGSFAVAFGAAVGRLVVRNGPAGEVSSAAQSADAVCYLAAKIGFVLFTLTILLGSIWADVAWGSFWNWDPKETTSLLTWLVFAAYLHARLRAGWSGKKGALLVVVGFLAVLVTFLGNFVFAGLHSYN